jgi:hypothetical protein
LYFLGGLLLMNALNMLDNIPLGAPEFLFGVLWGLAVIYLFQHRKSDGSIDWR